MTPLQVWGTLIIFTVCPLLGGLPLIRWIIRIFAGRQQSNPSEGYPEMVLAFERGGQVAGILAMASEALKGMGAVLLARIFFPPGSAWELIALIALIAGRYGFQKSDGIANAIWGCILHDWIVATFVGLIGGIGVTLVRDRTSGRLMILGLFPVMILLLHPYQEGRILGAIALSLVLYAISVQCNQPRQSSRPRGAKTPPETENREIGFFRADRGILSLDQLLDARKVGNKAAMLSQLKRWGYPVPPGWVLLPGDDPEPLTQRVQPSPQSPAIARPSPVGEGRGTAAGQYQSFWHLTDPAALQTAITQCLSSYDQPAANRYRRDRGFPEKLMAVLVQKQIPGVFSGIAFSRDPISRHSDVVVIEALPGDCFPILAAQVIPESYRVLVRASEIGAVPNIESRSWRLPDHLSLEIDGTGNLPPRLLQQVAFLTRHIETRFDGIPHAIEWTYDGENLWLLQARSIPQLLPIWTRQIATREIPGVLRSLSWSIAHPLMAQVWQKLLTLLLRGSSRVDASAMLTLHNGRAYSNLSLLTQISRQTAVSVETLEFLLHGSHLRKPPLNFRLTHLDLILRLLRTELRLKADFKQDYRKVFAPVLAIASEAKIAKLSELSTLELLQQVDRTFDVLAQANFYRLLLPVSVAFRQAIFKIEDSDLDYTALPEVAALQSLKELATATRLMLPHLKTLLPQSSDNTCDSSELFAMLAELTDGQTIFEQLETFRQTYGYLSNAIADIAVPTWNEDPRAVREHFTQFFLSVKLDSANVTPSERANLSLSQSALLAYFVQRQINLQGWVHSVYFQLIAYLRQCFLALEQKWLHSGFLSQVGDIFFLELDEIRHLAATEINLPKSDGRSQSVPPTRTVNSPLNEQLPFSEQISQRRLEFKQNRQTPIPLVIYGNTPRLNQVNERDRPSFQVRSRLTGTGASPGQVVGRLQVLQNKLPETAIDPQAILVVPNIDAQWVPMIRQTTGVIVETGGQLSHAATLLREYGIPAIMGVEKATRLLRDRQWVRIDGQQGLIEILASSI